MKKQFELLNEALEAGKSAVLVTVVASSGSTPRGAGDSDVLASVQTALQLLQTGDESWLATDVTPEGGGALLLYGAKSGPLNGPVPPAVREKADPAPALVEAEGKTYYIGITAQGKTDPGTVPGSVLHLGHFTGKYFPHT